MNRIKIYRYKKYRCFSEMKVPYIVSFLRFCSLARPEMHLVSILLRVASKQGDSTIKTFPRASADRNSKWGHTCFRIC